MKRALFIFALLSICLCAFGQRHSSGRAVYVHGYVRKNGTYVAPHYRSAPNHTTSDNWSHVGNINPYTGKIGTQTDVDKGENASASTIPVSPVTHPYQPSLVSRLYDFDVVKDPSRPDAYVAGAAEDSNLKTGDVIVGIRLIGGDQYLPVSTWTDISSFLHATGNPAEVVVKKRDVNGYVGECCVKTK